LVLYRRRAPRRILIAKGITSKGQRDVESVEGEFQRTAGSERI
jgi:hypothetical protein